VIYANRLSLKNPGVKLNSKDPYVKLFKIVIPLADFQSSAYVRSVMAVTAMDFSEDDQYLQMCCQRINSECVTDPNKYVSADDIFVVWDIGNNKMVTDLESCKN